MASQAQSIGGHPEALGATLRTDRWWVEPAITVAVLGLFGLYATWAAFQGAHYYAAPYLSPLYSPVLFADPAAAGAVPLSHAIFGAWPAWWPDALPASPAFVILMFPGAFRFTCYYYRKAYYRAFAGSPPGCAVVPFAKSRRAYQGETAWLLFQNLHRYAMYFALLFLPILLWDAAHAFVKDGRFGIGVGTVVLTVNFCALSAYTLGCHSLRHLVGGHDDCMSCGKSPRRYGRWRWATWFNERHGRFAWISLIWVGATDLYVRLVSQGVVEDFNTWGGG
jgi:hypothetical protein